jgi:hypothetical protein
MCFVSVAIAATVSGTPFGNATALGGGSYRLVSDMSNATPYAGVDFNTPASFEFEDINVLRATQQAEADDTCYGGSPRFVLNVDTNGDGEADPNKNVFVYTQNLSNPEGGCYADTGDLAEVGGSGDVVGTYDLSQIGGSGYTTYSDALAFFAANPTYRIVGVQFVVDAGWAFADGEQTITATPIVDITLAQPTNAAACRNGGWQNFQRANGTTFKNQGDCIQYVNTGR